MADAQSLNVTKINSCNVYSPAFKLIRRGTKFAFTEYVILFFNLEQSNGYDRRRRNENGKGQRR
jgi:hypothetical protein